jgi:hypothetical protein
VRLWDVADGTIIRTFPGIAGRVHSITLSSDGRLLAGSGETLASAPAADATPAEEIMLWDVAERRISANTRRSYDSSPRYHQNQSTACPPGMPGVRCSTSICVTWRSAPPRRPGRHHRAQRTFHNIALTATADVASPTGKVEFCAGDAYLGFAPVKNGVATFRKAVNGRFLDNSVIAR